MDAKRSAPAATGSGRRRSPFARLAWFGAALVLFSVTSFRAFHVDRGKLTGMENDDDEPRDTPLRPIPEGGMLRPMERALLAAKGHEVEEPEEPYFFYSASLRIFGAIPDLEAISRQLGVAPTHSHRRGERPRPTSSPQRHDMWSFQAPVAATEPLTAHLLALWEMARGHVPYLLGFRAQGLTVDVFCGYRSSSDCAGFAVAPAALEIFRALDTPFDVSVIVT